MYFRCAVALILLNKSNDNFIILLSMAELDTSNHVLNTSSSKQKYSFPKTARFSSNQKLLCDSFYEHSSTRTSRAPSFGYGQKDIGIRVDKYIPPVGTYNLELNASKNSFSFGEGREQMQLGGPLRDAKLHSFVPGPGNYDHKGQSEYPKYAMLRPRLPDNSQKHLLNIPGPGTYQHAQLGKNDHLTSKYRNFTNHRISQTGRMSLSKTANVGPGAYNTDAEDIKRDGRYHLSNHQSSRTRIFDKEKRHSLVNKHMVSNPGPGAYGVFSSFG